MKDSDSKTENPPVKEIISYQAGEHIIEVICDRDLVPEVQFAVYNVIENKVSYCLELKLADGTILKPSSLSILRDGQVLLPEYAADYTEESGLITEIEGFIHKYLDLPHQFYIKLVSHYVLLTWVYDKFTVIPYLRAVGDYGSGKTRFAQVVGALSFRPLFMAGATSDAFIFRMIELFKGTLIINELERVNTDLNNQITIILNNGYEKGLSVGRVEGDKKKEPKLFDVFSPKIITSRGKFKDQALESRILSIPLKPTKRIDIPPLLDSGFWQEATRLRNKLLMYRFKNVGIPDLEDKTTRLIASLGAVEPRLRQALLPLLMVVSDEAVEAEFIKYANEFQEQIFTDRSFEVEALIAEKMVKLFEEGGKVTVKQVTEQVNSELDIKLQLTSKAIGNKIRAFGFKTKKIQGVFQVETSDKVIEYLHDRYGLKRNLEENTPNPPSLLNPLTDSSSEVDLVDKGDLMNTPIEQLSDDQQLDLGRSIFGNGTSWAEDAV